MIHKREDEVWSALIVWKKEGGGVVEKGDLVLGVATRKIIIRQRRQIIRFFHVKLDLRLALALTNQLFFRSRPPSRAKTQMPRCEL